MKSSIFVKVDDLQLTEVVNKNPIPKQAKLLTSTNKTTLKILDVEYYDLKGVMTKFTCRDEAQSLDVYLLRHQLPFRIISVDFFFDKKLEQIFVNLIIFDY